MIIINKKLYVESEITKDNTNLSKNLKGKITLNKTKKEELAKKAEEEYIQFIDKANEERTNYNDETKHILDELEIKIKDVFDSIKYGINNFDRFSNDYLSMRKTILLFAFILQAISLQAQEFDKFFEDNTLRIDYILSGNNKSQAIYVKELCKKDFWAGRKARLTEEFLSGNGQLRVYDHKSGKLIYVHAFSTLFQEWLLEEEATRVSRAFEVSYNVPFPKRPVDVKVTLTDNHRKVIAEMKHTVDPADILIRKTGGNGIPYKYIMKNGDISDCIDLAFVAEGYTADEMEKFYTDCNRAVEALFTHEPFTTLKSKFNVVAVAPVSKDSGPSVPHKGVWHATALNSHSPLTAILRPRQTIG